MNEAQAFGPASSEQTKVISSSRLSAAPKRLSDNAGGPLYVNDKCINCAACSMFAPSVFGRSSSRPKHVVEKQPALPEEMEEARAALRACPVAAIRLENQAFRSHRNMEPLSESEEVVVQTISDASAASFPKRVSPNIEGVYFVGHHNSASFGAAPYLLSTKSHGWILVDSPKYSKPAVKVIESLTGPEGPSHLFLSHVDDTADHGKWKTHYPNLKRIFHSGDLGRHNWVGDETLEEVEVILSNSDPSSLSVMTLEGETVENSADNLSNHEVLIVHTPGHSPGSITLWKRPTLNSPGVLLTGDSYSYTTREGGHMTGFPRYGNNSKQQANTLPQLLTLDWHLIAPGHGHVRDYTLLTDDESSLKELQKQDMQPALRELLTGTI